VTTIAAAAFVVTPTAAARPQKVRPFSAQTILARLRGGQPVALSSVKVKGRLAFGNLQRVRTPFKCRDCRFPQGLDASDVVFERIVDLSGAQISGLANFEGATFEGPALFMAMPTPVEFGAGALFRLAVFDDLAVFDRATIKGRTSFKLARFRSQGSFSSTVFTDNVNFAGASLGGPMLFDHAKFDGHADFTRMSIGASDFRNAHFGYLPDFSNATFRGPANFGQTHFCRGVLFSGTQFSGGATFVETKFGEWKTELGADFASAGAGRSGVVDFTFAEFKPSDQVCEGINPWKKLPKGVAAVRFDDFVSGGTVALGAASLAGGRTIAMADIKVKDLRMTVRQTARLTTGRRAVLRIIEAGAKARGDLRAANDADYELHVLESRHFSRAHRIADLVFYRWIAGYLVRPLRPLIAIAVLAFLVSLTRVAFVRDWEAQPASGVARSSASADVALIGRALSRLMHEFFDALSRVAPRRGRNGDVGLATRLETAAYRVLIGCAIIGLANSNPTLRQLVDALK
jgi:uncharacterized protein YjbI with pentapeptide repeats